MRLLLEEIEKGKLRLLSEDLVNGLPGRQNLYLNRKHLIWVVNRKSRFLRKDADRFLEWQAKLSHSLNCELKGTVLVCHAPICSKARAHFENCGGEILGPQEL